jgi:hypothetical protein
MNPEIDWRLWRLSSDINSRLDKIHDELLAKLRFMAKSTGQTTRVDRL